MFSIFNKKSKEYLGKKPENSDYKSTEGYGEYSGSGVYTGYNPFDESFQTPIQTELDGTEGYGTLKSDGVYVGYNPFDLPFNTTQNTPPNPYLDNLPNSSISSLETIKSVPNPYNRIPEISIKPEFNKNDTSVNMDVINIPTITIKSIPNPYHRVPETAINIPSKEQVLQQDINNKDEIENTNTNQTETTNKTKDSMLNANRYYAMMTGANAISVLNNYLQQPPPGIQLDMPFLNRTRMDKTPFETERARMREQGRSSYRALREGISQTSDLMRGLTAVTSQTQEGLAKIGMAEIQQQNQIDQINNQIQNQEEQLQNQIINQETQLNYNIQAEAQKYKDQQINQSLSDLASTLGAWTKYNETKKIVEEQNKINRQQVQDENDIQAATLEWMLIQDELESTDYKTAKATDYQSKLAEMTENKYNSEAYKELRETYGEVPPSYNEYLLRKNDPEFMAKYRGYNRVAYAVANTPQPNKETFTGTDEEFQKAQENYNKLLKVYEDMKKDQNITSFGVLNTFFDDVKESYSPAMHSAEFAETYLKNKGLRSTQELINGLKATVERNRQELSAK